MSTNASNVSVGKPKTGGAAFIAAAGTTPPASAVSVLSSAFKDLGYISDEGVKNNGERSVNKIKAWGGDIVQTVQTEKTDSFTMTFIEALNDNVMKMVYGKNNVSGDLASGLTVLVNSTELDEWVLVIDMVLAGGTVLKRLVIPKAKVDSISEITYEDEDVIGYQCEITALPDTAGNTHYEYFKSSGASAIPDTTLSSLALGGLTLNPAFVPTTTSYTAATTDSTNTITAVATDTATPATVVIKNGSDTVESGGAATWTAGANAVTVTVTNGGYTKTYNINVTKS